MTHLGVPTISYIILTSSAIRWNEVVLGAALVERSHAQYLYVVFTLQITMVLHAKENVLQVTVLCDTKLAEAQDLSYVFVHCLKLTIMSPDCCCSKIKIRGETWITN